MVVVEKMVRQVEVVTDIHCYGVGATCGDLGGLTLVTAVLYYLGNFLMCFLWLAAFRLRRILLSSLVFRMHGQ